MRSAVCLLLLVLSVSAKDVKKAHFEEEENEIRGGYANMVTDPCREKTCGMGKECDLDDDNKPICVCTRHCAEESEPRAQVCSTVNMTFASECELYRQKCLCRHNQHGCVDPQNRHGHLDYFGPCTEIPECEPYDLQEYPIRMRQWLFFVMEELADRKDLKGEALKLAEEARTRETKKWVIPVIWKFCDLDTSLDRMISARELLPISAPLKPLEHCTGPFLKSCDPDNDGTISLEEWGRCLNLDPEDVEDICDRIRQ